MTSKWTHLGASINSFAHAGVLGFCWWALGAERGVLTYAGVVLSAGLAWLVMVALIAWRDR